jgi:hypothetical protein
MVTMALLCASVLAQASQTPVISNISELAVHKCDSLKNPVPGESLADASRRIRAWKECEENLKSTTERVVMEHFVRRVEVENGHLVVGALSPEVENGSSVLIHHLDMYLRNKSSDKHQYTLAVRCGSWNKTLSDTIPPSEDLPANQGLGNPRFSFDVSPPCNLNDMALDLSSPDQVKGNPQKASGSVVPGVSDDEMAQRLRSLKGPFTANAQGTGSSVSDLQKRVDEACRQQSVRELANGPVSSVGDHMKDCAKAYNDLTAALRAQGETQKQAKNAALSQPIPGGVLVVRLTGTEGLPFTGTCYYSNRAGTVSKSYDEVVPFQATMDNVNNVNCSFVSKSDFQHNLKLEIIKDGKTIGESDTDAPYGVVGVVRDVN